MTISVPLLITQPETCHYLPGQISQTVFINPVYGMTVDLYAQLIAKGFRRSGNDVYRSNCPFCSACIPVRIPVDKFKLSRNQKRCLNRNQHTQITIGPAEFKQQHYDLYLRYQAYKHPDGNMRQSTPDEYINFLSSGWCNTFFVEFSINNELAAVAIVDHLQNCLSAVYTFYAPECAELSPGVFAVLWQIDFAQQLGLDWLYLGYWIAECKKMSYKNQFQPLQIFQNEIWQTLVASV